MNYSSLSRLNWCAAQKFQHVNASINKVNAKARAAHSLLM